MVPTFDRLDWFEATWKRHTHCPRCPYNTIRCLPGKERCITEPESCIGMELEVQAFIREWCGLTSVRVLLALPNDYCHIVPTALSLGNLPDLDDGVQIFKAVQYLHTAKG